MVQGFNYLKMLWQRHYPKLSQTVIKVTDSLKPIFEFPIPSSLETFKLDSLHNFVSKGVLKVLYFFLIIILSLHFLVMPIKPSVGEKAVLAMLLLYLIWKSCYCIDLLDLPTLQKWVLTETWGISLLSAILHPTYGHCCAFLNSFLLMSCVFVTQNFIILTLGALLTACTNSFVISQCASCKQFSELSICMFLLFFFVICAMKIYSYNHDSVLNAFYIALQKAHDDLENKSLFVASVSHDLKNPLNAILISIEFIKSSADLSPIERKSLSTATYSGQVMLYLIGNILDVTKIGSGKFDLSMAPLSILDEIKKVVRIEKELAKQKSINVYKRAFTSIPPLVIGDSMRLVQVLINLMGNAIKFTSRGYVAVLMRWAKTESEAREDFLTKLFKNKFIEPNNELLIPPEEYFIIGSKISMSSSIYHHRKHSTEHPRKYTSKLESFGMEDQSEELRIAPFQNNMIPNLESKTPMNSAMGGFAGLTSRRLSRTHPIILTPSDNIIPIETVHNIQVSSSMDRVIEESSDMESDKSDAVELETAFPENKGYLVFDVIDTGIGMTKSEQARLFQPFSQANTGIRKTYGGTGLGLWIAKQLVELMGGQIKVRSKKNRGTVFTVVLPFKIFKADINASSPKKTHGVSSSKERRLIMSKDRVRTPSRDMSAFRLRGRSLFARDPTRKANKILVLENRTYEDDNKLEQVLGQFKKQNCLVMYGTFDKAVTLVQQEHFDFSAIVIIASASLSNTKAVYIRLAETIKEAGDKKPQLIFASDLSVQNELSELAGTSIVTFPIKYDTLANMVARAGKGAGEELDPVVEEIKQKSRSSRNLIEVVGEKLLVLVADDDVFSNLAVKTMVEKDERYQTLAVFNGKEALECYKEKGEDLFAAILDIEMPYMNGLEAAIEIRQEEKKNNRHKIPIIGLTGHESVEVKHGAIEAGMSVVFTKPVNFNDIIAVLKSTRPNSNYE